MIGTKIASFMAGTSAFLQTYAPDICHAWLDELSETESLPLWLLGLFVTLMLFRIKVVAARKKGKSQGRGQCRY